MSVIRRPPRIFLPLVAAALAAALLAGCGGGGSTTASSSGGCEQASQPPAKHVNLKRPTAEIPRGEALSATVETSCGSFEIALDTERSPKTAGSFAYMAKKGVYDDTAFHRIVPDFVIQGGDPLGDGTGGPGYFVDEAPPRNTSYTRGVVAMAKTAAEPPGRSGSQFFVVTTADAGLPADYAVLGKVSSGLDVVDRIASLGDPASGQTGTPLQPVVIRSVTISGGG